MDFNNLSIKEYDQLEKKMLDDFYAFLERHRSFKWVHWNMRDSNDGFEAIANRHKILSGIPHELEQDRLYNLAEIVGNIYTFRYETDSKGRLLNIAQRNSITTKEALKGEDESKAFKERKSIRVLAE